MTARPNGRTIRGTSGRGRNGGRAEAVRGPARRGVRAGDRRSGRRVHRSRRRAGSSGLDVDDGRRRPTPTMPSTTANESTTTTGAPTIRRVDHDRAGPEHHDDLDRAGSESLSSSRRSTCVACAPPLPRSIFAMSNLGSDASRGGAAVQRRALRHRDPLRRRGLWLPDGRARDDAGIDPAAPPSRPRVSRPRARSSREASGSGGLCRDPATGFQWLLGNAGPEPVEVEVRLGGHRRRHLRRRVRRLRRFHHAERWSGASPRRRPGRRRGSELESDVRFRSRDAGILFRRRPRGTAGSSTARSRNAVTVEFRLDGVPQATCRPLGLRGTGGSHYGWRTGRAGR